MSAQPGTSTPGRIYERAAQFQRELALPQSAAEDQVLASWRLAYTRIAAEYQQVLDKIGEAQAAGSPVSQAWLFQQERLRAAEATARAEMTRYAREATSATQEAMGAAGRASQRHAGTLVEDATSALNLTASFVDLNTANLRHLTGLLAEGSPVSDLFAGLGDEVATSLREALVQGVALGHNPNKMAQRIVTALDMPRHRAVTIMRTESQRVYREVARETYQQNADVLGGWVWTAALSPRTCVACIAMHGTVHPLTETLDGHPRCRCAMVPRTKSWADLGVGGEAFDSRPPIPDGKAWLEGQPERVQQAIMGRAKWARWKAGDLSMDDMVARTHSGDWGTMRRERSLVEIDAGKHANTLPGVAPTAPPRPQTQATPSMLAPEQYDALRPDRAWSEAKRQSILTALRGTPEGKVLADTLERFQDGGSIARLRTKIDKHLAGEAIDATSKARADALLRAIREAPEDWAPETLYRGMSVQGSLESVLAKYQPGGKVDLSLTSFTSDRSVAVRFQQMTAKAKTTRVMVELVGEGKRTLPIQDLPKDRRLWREKEWVTAGRYEVVEAKRAPGGGILVRMRQVGTL